MTTYCAISDHVSHSHYIDSDYFRTTRQSLIKNLQISTTLWRIWSLVNSFNCLYIVFKITLLHVCKETDSYLLKTWKATVDGWNDIMQLQEAKLYYITAEEQKTAINHNLYYNSCLATKRSPSGQRPVTPNGRRGGAMLCQPLQPQPGWIAHLSQMTLYCLFLPP